jgi:hypothetical protein
MNGLGRNVSRQEPGDDKLWPLPLPPAPVCCVKKNLTFKNLSNREMTPCYVYYGSIGRFREQINDV